MTGSYSKSKGRTDAPGGFAGIPRIVMDHQDYIGLSGGAVKLLNELARQYRGKNNGNLTAAPSVIQPRGCGAKATINRCIKELIAANMIIQTREGRFINPGAQCALYAITWQAIDECPSKDLTVKPTTTPIRKFSLEKNNKNPSPRSGLSSGQKLGRERLRDTKGRYQSVQKLARQPDSTSTKT